MNVPQQLTRRRFGLLAGAFSCTVPLGGLAQSGSAQPLEKAVMYIGWRAEPEWGGFFQALGAGIYKKHGLDVELRLGSPQSNPTQQLLGSRVDFIAGSSGTAISALREGVPFVTVAALMQKDPRILIAHPGQGITKLEDMRDRSALIAPIGRVTFWPFLRSRFGFRDELIKPYTGSLAPFLADKSVIQQGFITNEPYALEKAGVKGTVSILLADRGWDPYVNTIVTTRETAEKRRDYVQRFVDATIEGWYSYLYGDPKPGNELLKQKNPEMDDDQIAYAIRAIKQYGLVDSGDALKTGIGTMTAARWNDFYQTMAGAGLYPPGLDLSRIYTLDFVNKRVGMRP